MGLIYKLINFDTITYLLLLIVYGNMSDCASP